MAIEAVDTETGEIAAGPAEEEAEDTPTCRVCGHTAEELQDLGGELPGQDAAPICTLCAEERAEAAADVERELESAAEDVAQERQPELPTMSTVRSRDDAWWGREGEIVSYEKQFGPLEVRVEDREGGRAVLVSGPVGKYGKSILVETLILRPETADILKGMLDRAVKAAKV